MCTNGTQVPWEVPSLANPTTCKGWPLHQGLWPLLFSNSDVGSFTSHKNKSGKVLWDGTYLEKYWFYTYVYYMTVVLAVSEANQTLQDPDKVKKINEILEEARAMVKKSVSC